MDRKPSSPGHLRGAATTGKANRPQPAPPTPGHAEYSEGRTHLQARAPLVLGPYPHATGSLRVYPRRIDIEPYPTTTHVRAWSIPRRGQVTEFSRRSRYRMFRQLAAIRLDVLSRAWFATLTYHHAAPTTPDALNADRRAFIERVRRRYPGLCYVWRLQFQRRGAAHWHLLLWSLSRKDQWEDPRTAQWLSRIWHEIAEPDSDAHAKHGARIDRAGSIRQLVSYMSRYVASTEQEAENGYTGRRWANSYHLPIRPVATAEAPDRLLRRLRRAARLLARLRGAGWRYEDACNADRHALTILLRDGEPERLLRAAGFT